jgi:hypothetical protein
LILGTDGKIYDYSENTTEYGSARPGGARKVIENKLQFARKGTLLGLGRGKPFAVLQEELERLPYKL